MFESYLEKNIGLRLILNLNIIEIFCNENDLFERYLKIYLQNMFYDLAVQPNVYYANQILFIDFEKTNGKLLHIQVQNNKLEYKIRQLYTPNEQMFYGSLNYENLKNCKILLNNFK